MSSKKTKFDLSRRDWLKSIATVPVLGGMAYGLYKNKDIIVANNINRNQYSLPILKRATPFINKEVKPLKVGVIGCGLRGKMLMRNLGYVSPETLLDFKNNRPNVYEDVLNTEQLNIEIVAVCDIFNVYLSDASRAAANILRSCEGSLLTKSIAEYKDYINLLDDENVEAVIIATPDHWHATMAIEAAKRGKHIYLEKPFAWTLEETIMAKRVIEDSGVVFQLGHQGRQSDIYHKAKQVLEDGCLGKLSLIEVTTNRNDPNGAWVYNIHPEASKKTVDWQNFIPPLEQRENFLRYIKSRNINGVVDENRYNVYSSEFFFRWRCWWEFSSGLIGDLFTHEYDVINQLLNIGIPASAVTSGGVYFYKDGRTVPDVLQTTLEFPEKELTLLYSATLASDHRRGKLFMGHDASMELKDTLVVNIDPSSTKFAKEISDGIIDPETPFYQYVQGMDQLDGLTSATELYFAKRGLLDTKIGNKRYSSSYLHMLEWVNCIVDNKKPSCGIDAAFEEAVTSIMASRACLEERKVFWNKDKCKIE